MTLQELQKLTVVKLKEMAMEYPDVKGASGMKKDQLVALLAEKLGIETEEDKPVAAPKTKVSIKNSLKELKAMKQEAIANNDRTTVALCRNKIRTKRRQLRKLLKQA